MWPYDSGAEHHEIYRNATITHVVDPELSERLRGPIVDGFSPIVPLKVGSTLTISREIPIVARKIGFTQ